MSSDRGELVELSQLERELMEIVWQLGEVSARSARQLLGETKPLARNTVRTLLDRMEKKGWLIHREEERTFIYAAALSREVSVGQKVAEVVQQVCGNSPEQLMAALLDYRGLTSGELKRIRTMLDQAKAKRNISKGNKL